MSLICGCIYKPKRSLYYMIPTSEEKQAFFDGIIPQKLLKYNSSYGTYDCPGLFNIRRDDGVFEVLGIEYRGDDEQIEYPDDLEVITLKGSYMVSALVSDIDRLNEEIVKKSIDELLSPDHPIYYYNQRIVLKKDADVVEVFNLNNKNRILMSTRFVDLEKIFYRPNITTELEKQLYHTATHEPVTGHYNWSHIWEKICGYSTSGIQDYAFIHFDVKEFKALNIVYGHEVANSVLCRVVEHMNAQDWIYHSARCHNDNFAAMIKDMPEALMKEKLEKFFDEISILEADEKYHIYYRCGVVPMRNTLLLGDRVADAGKQVQRMGTKLYETEVLFYDDSMTEAEGWSIQTKTYLDTAIKNDEFLIYLQPKYDINTDKLYGAEALIRWMYRGQGLLPPYRFIPIFETGGLISKLDDIVLNKVCNNLRRWKEEGKPLRPISVNLSRKSLGNVNLVDHLTSIVDKYGVDHKLIDFELTESAAYDDQANMICVLGKLKERGFKVSMDDFGTGYSSLSLLSSIPIDTIKIDKSFVDKIGSDKDDEKELIVLRHIINMGKELGLMCLAEGAEEKSQIERLKELGLEYVQGYYYDKPLPVSEYEDRLDRFA